MTDAENLKKVAEQGGVAFCPKCGAYQIKCESCAHVLAENARLIAVVEAADRWRKRKGHGPDHDCDLCNALRALKAVEGRRGNVDQR